MIELWWKIVWTWLKLKWSDVRIAWLLGELDYLVSRAAEDGDWGAVAEYDQMIARMEKKGIPTMGRRIRFPHDGDE